MVTVRRAFILGALTGELTAAVVGVLLLLPFPFSHSAHLSLVTIGFWFCPFYMLMFMSLVHSMGAVVAISFVGNGVVYGTIGVVVRYACRCLGFGNAGSFGSAAS